MRERAILERLANGDRTIPEIVARIYRDIDPKLHAAAALSTLAQLEDLVERGLVLADGVPSLAASYWPADASPSGGGASASDGAAAGAGAAAGGPRTAAS